MNRAMSACLRATMIACLTAPVATAQTVKVGPNVHVSRARSNQPHYEIHVTGDPRVPGRLLGAAMIWDTTIANYNAVVYASSDGGASWQPTLHLKKSDYVNDPALALGPDGAAYFSSFGSDEGGETEMWVYRSTDGGRTWTGFTKVPPMDREWLTVDRTNGKYRGRVYVNGTRGAPGIDGPGASGISIVHSKDSGVTFEGLTTLVVSDPAHFVIGMGNGAVLSDGTLVILFGQWRNRNAMMRPGDPLPATPTGFLKVVTSSDGGESFAAAKLVADWHMHFPGSMMPYLAVDESDGPFRDRLYAVFADYRSGRGEILFSYSADKGDTWSSPTVVNDDLPPRDEERRDHFMPLVAVNRHGVVGVMWYDRRDHPGNSGFHTRFAASVDGGETFLPSVPVSEAPYDMSRSEGFVFLSGGGRGTRGAPGRASVSVHNFNRTGGHTAGMAATGDGTFHPFWVDNRTRVPQVWSAPVTVDARGWRHGDSTLAALEDASGKVELRLRNVAYDAKTGRVLLDATLVNSSSDTVRGPIRVRVLRLSGQHGQPELTRSDNGRTAAGALLDMSALLTGGALAPRAISAVRRLEFRLRNPSALHTPAPYPRQSGASSLVDMEVRILAPRNEPPSRTPPAKR